MTFPVFDILIVGSGPSGIQAAKAAVDRGVSVAMVDVGHVDEHYAPLVPDQPFSEIRKTDSGQSRYFLGDHLEGILRETNAVGAQLTPPRLFLIRDAEKYLPMESKSFFPLQSLALGGLAAGWGAGSAAYEDFELERAGLPPREIKAHYGEVVKDIGISGAADDDISPHITDIPYLQEPLELDSNAEAVFKTYQRNREKFISRGFKIGRPPLAVLTRPLEGRQPNPYYDMDFWGESRESIYRPRYTLRDLLKKPNFTYIRRTLAVRFEEEGEGVRLHARNIDNGEAVTFQGRRLLLAAGAINTARLTLRSLNLYNVPVPILCNPYTYGPAVNLPMLGRPARDRRHSLVQLTGILFPPDAPQDEVIAQFYSYRSMLLFRLVKEMPLPPSLGLLMARLILTSLFIIGINHPDIPSANRFLELRRGEDGEEILHAHYERSEAEMKIQKRRERLILRNLLALRCVPMKVIHLKPGASIHYAGTLPFNDREKPLTCEPTGKIRGTKNVFAADGSPWKYLPAKGLTLTLMANARRVADEAVKDLKNE
jgi:choline dehydrogenase-like flavoprotein